MFTIKSKAFSALLTLTIISAILTILLAACGASDSPTPLPTPTPAPSPTPLPSPTPAPATATTSASSTNSNSSSTTALNITGATAIPLDDVLVQTLAKNLPGITNPAATLYATDDTPDSLANTADAQLVAQGYTFAIPGSTKPTKLGTAYIGVYSKTGAPDIVIATSDIPADPTQLAQQFNFPGITPDLVQQYAGQLKGKKSALVVISGSNLLQALFTAFASGAGGSGATGATAGSATSSTPTTGS